MNQSLLRLTLLTVIVSSASAAFTQERRRDATLAEQKMCSDQAQKIKDDDQARFPNASFDVTSHYSKAKNICWVSVRMMHIDKNGTLTSEMHSLLDGFEQVVYGSCAANEAPKHEILTCWVTDPSTGDKKDVPDATSWRSFVETNYFKQ